jgi:hypothetical protein
MFANEGFVPAAPRFPERVTVQVPKGMRSAISRAARQEKTTSAELLRRAIAALVSENGAPRNG